MDFEIDGFEFPFPPLLNVLPRVRLQTGRGRSKQTLGLVNVWGRCPDPVVPSGHQDRDWLGFLFQSLGAYQNHLH